MGAAPDGSGAGTALLALTVFGVSCSNISDLLANARVDMALMTVTPLQLVVAGIAGVSCVRAAVQRVVASDLHA